MSPTTVVTEAEDRHTVRGRLEAWRRSRRGRVALYASSVALVALAYYLAGRLGLELAYLDGAVAALWPPAGLGLAVLFLYGVRLWPGIVIGDLLLARLLDAARHGRSARRSATRWRWCVAALLLRRLTGGRGELARVFDVLAFVVCAVLAARSAPRSGRRRCASATLIAADELGRVFRTWTLGDASGVLVVAPALLTWAATGVSGFRRRDLVGGRGRCSSLLVVLAELPPQRDVPYIVFPVLLWAALRFGPRGAATAILVVCSITVWNTAHERRAVRARLDHRQPARHAALHRDLGAHLAPPRRGDRRAHRRGPGAGGQRGGPARARRRAGGAAPGRHARRRRVAAQPGVRAGAPRRSGGCWASPARPSSSTDGARTATVVGAWSEDGQAALPGRRVARARRRHGRREGAAQRQRPARGALRRGRRDAWRTRCASVGYRAAVAAPVSVGGPAVGRAGGGDDVGRAAAGGRRAAAVRLRRPRRAGAGERRRL